VNAASVVATLRFLLHLEEDNRLVFSKWSSGARFARVLCTFLLGIHNIAQVSVMILTYCPTVCRQFTVHGLHLSRSSEGFVESVQPGVSSHGPDFQHTWTALFL